MTNLNITTGSIATLDLSDDTVDSGWEISGEYAIHYPCNAGYIKKNLALTVGNTYVITYEISNWVSGNVNVVLGTTNGASHAANGVFTDTLLCTGTGILQFFSDGFLRVKTLKYYDVATGTQDGLTISYHENERHWGCDYSFGGDMFVRFINKFFSFNSGGLWLHNTNPLRNNFYGVQYPSQLTFVVNADYKLDKLFFNIRLDAKGKWSAPLLQTVGGNQFPNGMVSRLKSGNFKQIDGKLWSAILSDINDPNFAGISDPNQRALTALFNGRKMQGGWLIVELQCNDSTEAVISSATVYFSDVFRGY